MFATRIILAVIVAGGIVDRSQAGSEKYVPGEALVRFAAKQDGRQRTIGARNAILAECGGGACIKGKP